MPRKQLVSVSEAARLVHMTPSGIYGAIKKKRIPTSRKDGIIVVRRADVIKYRRDMDHALAEADRIRRGDLTEDELVQRMIDNDPDD